MARASVDLGDGVRQYQPPLWQTNCLLATARGGALLCDPSYTQAEIDELVVEVGRAGTSAVHLLVTHADYDHVCGLASFPGATVVALESTAARVRDGSAAAGLAAAAEEWGIPWPVDGLRVDRSLPGGDAQ